MTGGEKSRLIGITGSVVAYSDITCFGVLSGLPVTRPEPLAMSRFEIGYTDKCQKNHRVLDSPQRERASHHLLERMPATAGHTTLEIIATSNEIDASL
jgi:hypothetical protein